MTTDNIRTLRTQNEMTQQQLATFCGVTQTTVSSWECGKTKIPKSVIIALQQRLQLRTIGQSSSGLAGTFKRQELIRFIFTPEQLTTVQTLCEQAPGMFGYRIEEDTLILLVVRDDVEAWKKRARLNHVRPVTEDDEDAYQDINWMDYTGKYQHSNAYEVDVLLAASPFWEGEEAEYYVILRKEQTRIYLLEERFIGRGEGFDCVWLSKTPGTDLRGDAVHEGFVQGDRERHIYAHGSFKDTESLLAYAQTTWRARLGNETLLTHFEQLCDTDTVTSERLRLSA